MKKIISILLVVSLLMVGVVGCAKKEDKKEQPKEQQTSGSTQKEKKDEKKDEAKEDVKIEQEKPFHVLMNQVKPGWPQKLEDDIVRQEVQKRSGFEYDIEAYVGEDYKTKIQLLLASGEYPDIWYGNNEQVAQWKQAGVIIPLDELLEQYGQDLKKVLHEKSLEAAKLDGQLWSIPQGWKQDDPSAGPLTEGLVIRKDWLDNLGLEAPTTLDDYYEVLKAFKNNDPDQNGKNDTYGLTVQQWKFGHIYTAFGVHPGDWYERDGKFVIGEMTEEFKEAVKLLAKWYGEGLIDPEFPVYTKGPQIEEKLVGNIVGSTYSHVWTTQSTWKVEAALRETNPEADFIMVPALEGPNGDRGYRAPKYSQGNSLVISSQVKHPELIMQFINWYAQDENWLLPHLGIEGQHWNYADGTKDKITQVDEWKQAKKRFTVGIGNPNRIIRISDRRHSAPDLLDSMKTVTKYTLSNAFEGSVDAMKNYPQLEKMVQQTVIRVILGDVPVEELDKMQERWYKEGGQDITDQVNEAVKK